MKRVRICPSQGETAVGTVIETADGVPIHGVTEINVRFRADAPIEAEVSVRADLDEVWALPWMSEESFLRAAERYSYRVEKQEQ